MINLTDFKTEAKTEAAQWARSMLRQPFVVLDLETTGFDGVPTQIAIIDHQGRALFNSLINPVGFEIHPKAQDVTGITPAMVADAPTFAAVHEELRAILRGQSASNPRMVIAYNANFDRARWNDTENHYGLTPIPFLHWSCAMEAYAKFYGAWDTYHRSFTWQKLGNACKQQGIAVDGFAHDALVDVRMTHALLLHMADWQPNQQAEQLP